ncbi:MULTISPECIES: thiol-disulfide oxidoreductase DCC family protein [unclassified Moraxella]|uniref:thiol-disulfide oxidoreductase DCC family protein n=1 Tax=unclassified Moraxella TaxID=2685852 RepID=UPI003AF8A57B
MLTMFYDSECPICRTEAYHLNEKSPDKVKIVAVDDALDTLQQAGISRTDAMTYLCVQDEDGKMHTHMDAVRLLYTTTGANFAWVLHLPVIKQVGDVVYPIFARNRYYFPDWLTHLVFGKVAEADNCKDGVCHIPPTKRT